MAVLGEVVQGGPVTKKGISCNWSDMGALKKMAHNKWLVRDFNPSEKYESK